MSQITFRESKGEASSSISSSRRSVRFYEASKHSSLALINQELCRHSLRLPVVSYTSCILSHASYPPLASPRSGKVKGQAWWGRSILSAIFLAWPRSLMSSESRGVLTERTSCAIHAFLFLWPEIFSWFPFQIVLWTFYQYEVIVTQYIRLVIQAIQSFVCKAEAPGFPKMGDQKIESLCVSWWSLLLVVFLFFLADSSYSSFSYPLYSSSLVLFFYITFSAAQESRDWLSLSLRNFKNEVAEWLLILDALSYLSKAIFDLVILNYFIVFAQLRRALYPGTRNTNRISVQTKTTSKPEN